MQSFRERSGFHGNQHCYQQEPYELSRLESYRHHHSQTRQGYEAHSLAAAPPTAAAAAAVGTVVKDCYGQPVYPSYVTDSAQNEKQYKGGKVPGQNLQSSYSGHHSTGYSTSYISEGHLQQKWDDSPRLPQYGQDMLRRIESANGPRADGSQYLQQNLLTIPQTMCSHTTQSSTPVYTSRHQPKLQQDTSTSPMIYTHGQPQFPQQSQSLSTSTPAYVEKCIPAPQCYKSYPMAPNLQYNRHMGNSSGLKQSSNRSQNNYVYQQPPSRTGYEQQAPLQGMPSPQDNLSKYQHFNQLQQNYCLSDISVRSPEQYYQNCSPRSSHSPARSVGRSPTYSATPSPLMVNSENFQYNQSTISSGTSSSTNLREQGLHMPQQSLSSPSVNHKTTNYAGTLKDRFSEKLLSNPSLWSLNALTSQVENISNNVQQLLLPEAIITNKKGSKRNIPKHGEDFKAHLNPPEEGSCSDLQRVAPVTEAFSTSQTMNPELQEGGHSSRSEDQLEKGFYFYCQNSGPVQATTNSQPGLEMGTCSMNSTFDISTQSESAVTVTSLQIRHVGENLSALLKGIGEEKSAENKDPSQLNPEQTAPGDIQSLNISLKEKSEGSSLSDKPLEEEEKGTEKVKEQLTTNCLSQTEITSNKSDEWVDDEKYPLFPKISKVMIGKNYSNVIEERIYQELKQGCVSEEGNTVKKSCSSSDVSCKGNVGSDVESEVHKPEFPLDSDSNGKSAPFVWRDYLTMRENDSEFQHFSTSNELFDKKLLSASKDNLEALEEQRSPLSAQTNEVIKETVLLTSSTEVIINKAWSQSGESSSPVEEQGNKWQASTESEVQDIMAASPERRSVICDVTPLKHSVKTVFSVFNEEATPLSQSRDRIDRRDAVELEPESPQLPGKSIMHSAPSWADTPPSPKKGDEEIDRGMSCPSAVTPSNKSEPVAPTVSLRAFNRKHARGRRRQSRILKSGILMHTSVQIRQLMGVDDNGVPGAPEEISMPSHNVLGVAEAREATHKYLSSKTDALFAENLPARMCTRSFTAMAVPKACLHLKRQLGSKPSKGIASKNPTGHSRGLVSKIKWKKQRSPKPAVIGHMKARSGLSEIMHQDENQDTTFCLSPLLKDQKPMVLRSRKQAQEIPLKEQGKEKHSICILPKTKKENKKQKAFLKDQSCLSPKKNLASAQRKGIYRALISKPDEKSVHPIKRKSSFQSVVPMKKQRTIRPSKLDQPLLKTDLTGAKCPKKRQGQGEHLKLSLSTFLTKDPSPVDVACIPPQCPAKTKYLPPRKGRGLKYEAMVQNITSPTSKKHVPNTSVKNTLGSLPKKTTLQDVEENKATEAADVNLDGSGDMGSASACAAASAARRRKGASGESVNQPEPALGTGGGIVSTPRLAKQRAIKNNHEMHLRKRRKRLPPPQCSATAGQEEPLPTPASPVLTEDHIGSAQAETGNSRCKKGKLRSPHSKKRQPKVLGTQCIKLQKYVANMKNMKYLNAAKTAKNHTLKARHRKQGSALEDEQQPESHFEYVLYKPKNENLLPFSPHVHIDRQENFASLCTVINRPEEEQLLFQARKKAFAKMQNPVVVAKAIPNSAVLLQGPLVNKSLAGHCLTCCLCGKPANYRELGDLYGPYYPEDSIPRKALFLKHRLESREVRGTTNCSLLRISTLEKEEGSCSVVRPGRPKRPEKTPGDSVTLRPKFLKRHKRLRQLQGNEQRAWEGEGMPLREQEGSGTVPEGLDLEANRKEHWVHEACAVWTVGVFLIAGKLYGLKDATQAAADTRCSQCQDVGASISCFYKDCRHIFHYFCAKDIGCLLQEESLKLKCTEHEAL